jgi:hypothetical protein
LATTSAALARLPSGSIRFAVAHLEGDGGGAGRIGVSRRLLSAQRRRVAPRAAADDQASVAEAEPRGSGLRSDHAHAWAALGLAIATSRAPICSATRGKPHGERIIVA